MPQFSPEWIALSRESAISGQSISAGLAALRKANYAASGLYSHAFFSLSIGLERLLKLNVLLDYAIREGSYPTEKHLRNEFGHDIEKLYAYTLKIHDRIPKIGQRYPIKSGGIEDRILEFLSQFAKISRYYNLDYLGKGKNLALMDDPIREWNNAIGSQILAKHYSGEQRKKDEHAARVMQTMLGMHADVLYTVEDGTQLTDLKSASLQTAKNKIIQKYGTFYCAKIMRFLYVILWDLVREAQSKGLDVPYLDESFFPFMNKDSYLLSRKTFPPRGQ